MIEINPEVSLTTLRGMFGASVALARAEDSARNMIALAWKNGAPLPSLEALIERADRYAGQHGVDLVEAAMRIEAGASFDSTRLGASLAT